MDAKDYIMECYIELTDAEPSITLDDFVKGFEEFLNEVDN